MVYNLLLVNGVLFYKGLSIEYLNYGKWFIDGEDNGFDTLEDACENIDMRGDIK